MLLSLPRLLPVLGRHVLGYAELAALDARDAVTHVTERVLAILGAAFAAAFTLGTLCLLVIAMTWDTPYRVASLVALFAAFAVITLAACSIALRKAREDQTVFRHVRESWRRDQVALRDALDERASLEAAGRGVGMEDSLLDDAFAEFRGGEDDVPIRSARSTRYR